MSSVRNTIAHNSDCASVRGKKVLVRVFGGTLVERRLWDARAGIALVCVEEVFESLSSGIAGPPPTAFPLADVIDPDTGLDLAYVR